MLDFPSGSGLQVDDLFPDPPIAGVPVWRWNGEKWIAQSGDVSIPEPPDQQVYGRRLDALGEGQWSRSVAIAGDIMTGNLNIWPGSPFGPPTAASSAELFLRATEIGYSSNLTGTLGMFRQWTVRLGDGTPANDFQIIRHDDAGIEIDRPLTINRSNGTLWANSHVLVPNGLVHAQTYTAGPTNPPDATAFTINMQSGHTAQIVGQQSGTQRMWRIQFPNDTGDFKIVRKDDTGIEYDALQINRANGDVLARVTLVSPTAPAMAGLPDGQLWWDSTGGAMYILYNDGTSRQWVPASPAPRNMQPRGHATVALAADVGFDNTQWISVLVLNVGTDEGAWFVTGTVCVAHQVSASHAMMRLAQAGMVLGAVRIIEPNMGWINNGTVSGIAVNPPNGQIIMQCMDDLSWSLVHAMGQGENITRITAVRIA